MEQTLEEKLMEYLHAIERGATELAPQAWETAKQVVRADAGMDLLAGVAWLIVGLLLVFGAAPPLRAWAKKDDLDEPLVYAPWFFASFGGICIAAGNTLGILMDKHIWFGLFAPDFEMARQVYLKLIAAA